MTISLAIFWIGSILGVSYLTLGCMFYRQLSYYVFGMMIFALSFEHASIHFESEANYGGVTRGFEVHLADLLCLVIAIHMLQFPEKFKLCWFPPLTIPIALYLFICFISWTQTESYLQNPTTFSAIPSGEELPPPQVFRTWLYPIMGVYKIFRGFFMYWVTLNFVIDKKAVSAVAISMAFMLFYAALISVEQRYILGIHRVSGLSHFNIFNCFIGMLGCIVMPFALYKKDLFSSLFYWAAVLAGLLAIILTVSRSSLVGYLLAIAIIFVLALRRFRTSQNLVAAGLITLLCLAFLVKAGATLSERFFEIEPPGQLGERELFIGESLLMGSEHFFGVGLNNFSAFTYMGYADIIGGKPGGVAHNIWYLTYAELGLPGLIVFANYWIWVFSMLFMCFVRESRNRNDIAYIFLLGITGAMIVLQLQDMYHYSYFQTSIFLLTSVIIGLTARISLSQTRISI